VSSLDSFRQETREWLEENCPQSMRSPMTNVENDQCWGGRKWTFKSEDQKLWMERMGAKGWTSGRLRVKIRNCGWREWVLRVGLHQIGPKSMVGEV